MGFFLKNPSKLKIRIFRQGGTNNPNLPLASRLNLLASVGNNPDFSTIVLIFLELFEWSWFFLHFWMDFLVPWLFCGILHCVMTFENKCPDFDLKKHLGHPNYTNRPLISLHMGIVIEMVESVWFLAKTRLMPQWSSGRNLRRSCQNWSILMARVRIPSNPNFSSQKYTNLSAIRRDLQ